MLNYGLVHCFVCPGRSVSGFLWHLKATLSNLLWALWGRPYGGRRDSIEIGYNIQYTICLADCQFAQKTVCVIRNTGPGDCKLAAVPLRVGANISSEPASRERGWSGIWRGLGLWPGCEPGSVRAETMAQRPPPHRSYAYQRQAA